MDKKPLGQYLLDEKVINADQLQKALQVQANSLSGGSTPLIGTVLVQLGAAKEQDITFALEKQERDRMRL